MAQSELVAKLIIDNTEALRAMEQVQKEGVAAVQDVANEVDQLPLSFVAWDRAVQAVGQGLVLVVDQLKKGIELAAENADVNSAAFREYNELVDTYEALLTYIGELIIDNEDFAKVLEKVQLLLVDLVDSGQIESMVDDFARLLDEITTLLDWSIRLRDVWQDMANVFTGRALTNVIDNIKGLTGAVNDSAEAIDEQKRQQGLANKERGDAIRLGKEQAETEKYLTEALKEQASVEEQFAARRKELHDAEMTRSEERRKEWQKLWDDLDKKYAEDDARLEKVKEDEDALARMYIYASEEEQKFMEQVIPDIHAYTEAYRSGSMSRMDALRLEMDLQAEQLSEQEQYAKAYLKLTEEEQKRIRKKIPMIEEWAEAYKESIKTVDDVMREWLDESLYGANRVTMGLGDTADAVDDVGGRAVSAMRNLAEAAGLVNKEVMTAKTLSSSVGFDSPEAELAAINNGTHPLIRRSTMPGMSSAGSPGFFPSERRAQLEAQIRDSRERGSVLSMEDAEQLGTAFATALARFADKDGTLMLAKAGVRV